MKNRILIFVSLATLALAAWPASAQSHCPGECEAFNCVSSSPPDELGCVSLFGLCNEVDCSGLTGSGECAALAALERMTPAAYERMLAQATPEPHGPGWVRIYRPDGTIYGYPDDVIAEQPAATGLPFDLAARGLALIRPTNQLTSQSP